MNTPVAYLICRCNSQTAMYAVDQNRSHDFSPHSLIFDDCSLSTLHCIKHILSLCPALSDLYYLYESHEPTSAEQNMIQELQSAGCAIHYMLCDDLGKTSYTRQRRHKRFMTQMHYLFVASDRPSSEINNAIRAAHQQSIPTIRFLPRSLHFCP